MAFLGYSDDFELDDDGILRDSTESGGILIDDDGIVRDDFDLQSKHGSSTHWTDSGLGGDKPSSTPSTLRQLDLQSYPSFEDVSRNLDESNINISDLEASKDDLSFDADYNQLEDKDNLGAISRGNRSGLSSRSSFDHSLNYDENFGEQDVKPNQKQDLFGEEYYKQLQELGVLVDEGDFANPRESLEEFENLENHYSRDYDNDKNAAEEIEQFLGGDVTRDSMDIEGPNDLGRSGDRLFDESQGFDGFDHRNHTGNEGKRTRPNTASSTRTISSRSFPEISPEEALELYTERLQSLENGYEDLSIPFEDTASQRTDQNEYTNDDEIYFVPSQENNDIESPKPAKLPAYDNENKPSMTPNRRGHPRSRSEQSSQDSRSGTPKGHGHEGSDRSRSVTPQADPDGYVENTGYHSNDDRFDSFTQVTRLDSRNKTQSESDTFRPDSALSNLSSAASESRSARPKMNKTHGKPPKQQKGNLSHAKSQESFFDLEDGSPKKIEKGPKRLLPKPSSGEETQTLKMHKSKSATNLNMSGPVKPTHMTLSEIRSININIDPEAELPEIPDLEPKSTASDVPKGELTKKLKQESSKRQQATQLVKQLQSDYDKLLSKYALAELTIDQMRLGAKISLHAPSPTPSQATSGSLQSAQHLQMLQLAGAQRGSIASASPQQPPQNVFFPEAQTIHEGVPSFDGRAGPQQGQTRGTSPALLPRSDSINSMDSTSTPRGDVEQPGGIANDAEKVKLGLLFQAHNLDERMQSFQALLGENQLTIEEQEGVFDTIRTDHEKLRRDYLQSKEDYNVLRRSTSAGVDVAFDQEKELEGELFKLGMKFDEIHETVDDNLKEKSAKRQPFQQKRRESGDNVLDDSMEVDPSTENLKKKIHGVSAGNDLLEPKPDSVLDEKLKHLHEEYNALMDRYRRLKQMAKTPEREQEIDNLVRKLKKICNEEPDIFKMPQDTQQGPGMPHHTKKLPPTPPPTQSSENKSLDKRKSDSKTEGRQTPSKNDKTAAKTDKSPAKSYEILTASETWSLADSIDRWKESKRNSETESKEAPSRSKSQENLLNASMASNRSFRSDRSYDSHHDEPDSGRLRARDRHGSYSSLSSRGHGNGRYTPDTSSHDRESPVPSLPRPRRHDHPDRERRDRRELKKSPSTSPDLLRQSTGSLGADSGICSLHSSSHRQPQRPEVGSTGSLQDSGISEHEGGATGYSGPNSPLSKLPGPGKFKQMTGRRELDTDSGFIGSAVGSEVSAGNLSARRQPPQQSPLRLRHAGRESPNQRPSSRQSSRSEDSARATTPRSARSGASSRSSRRTPTKAFPLGGASRTAETQADEQEEDRDRTPTREDVRTPTRTDSRNKSRDQKTPQRRRDYTDDSYTSVTESEMSFDGDARGRRHRPSSRNNTSLRSIDKIMEDSEEDIDEYTVDPSLNETTDLNMSWMTTDSERQSTKQGRRQADAKHGGRKTQEAPAARDSAKQPFKGQGQKLGQGSNQGQGQVAKGRNQPSSRMTTDDDTSLTLSPTRGDTTGYTQDTTADTYTSDETTPRSVIERERKQARQQRASQQAPAQETRTKRGPSPITQTAPPARATTPVKRSEVHPKRLHEATNSTTSTEAGPQLRAAPPANQPHVGLGLSLAPATTPKYINRSVGSGTEEEILASDAETAATGATRDSVNSARLKMLSAEIDQLREEFKRANHEKSQQQAPPPAPPTQPQDQYYDQYFDPTEDPLAFMRGPRRRANSFSGHGGRDWGYDWTLPDVNRDGDIPLGYAAADAYASPRRKTKPEENGVDEQHPSRRGRSRLRQKIHQRNMGTQHYPEQTGYDSDQSPTRRAEEVQQAQMHYGYQQQTGMSPAQQKPPQGPPSNLQSGRRVFGSQPNLAFTGYQPPPAPRSTSGSTKSSTAHTPNSQRPLRQTLYSYAANPTQNRPNDGQNYQQNYPTNTRVPFSQRAYANDDIHINDGQTQFVPHGARNIQGSRQEGGVYTSSCPLCGSTSSHTHGDFVYPPTDHRAPLGYLVHDGRQLLETIQVPVYSMPADYEIQNPMPHPLVSHSFRSPMKYPYRLYKAPPPIKPHLFPINIHKQFQTSPTVQFQIPPQRNQPMAASHDAIQPIIEWDLQEENSGENPRSRTRSRSLGRAGRIRHYSPDGRTRSRYFVREYGDISSPESAESDSEEMVRRRSRSVGRRRNLKHGRKYKRVRGDEEYESDRGLRRGGLSLSAAGEEDLNRSLRLVGEIDELTNKMMDTVSGELAMARRKKDFGSTIW